MPYVKTRTLGTSHSRAIVKIIQDGSLPPPLEICEFRFDVNNSALTSKDFSSEIGILQSFKDFFKEFHF